MGDTEYGVPNICAFEVSGDDAGDVVRDAGIDHCMFFGHTKGMKVAVSIPDPIFAEAEVLAKRLKLSRSGIYARALDAYVASHASAGSNKVTDAMNSAVERAGDQPDRFHRKAARRVFAQTEW